MGCMYQVVNRTSMQISLGLKHSMRMDPAELGSLAAGRHMYLPVLRPEPGMLCIQPLGELHCIHCQYHQVMLSSSRSG